MKYKVGKHHNFSLIVLFLCFIITLFLEILYKSDNIPLGRFIFAHFLICLYFISITITDSIERYLSIYEFINPFLILMFEGIIGFIMSIFYSINSDPFKSIIDEYKIIDSGEFALLIILLIIYLLCSAELNVYKVYRNVI